MRMAECRAEGARSFPKVIFFLFDEIDVRV